MNIVVIHYSSIKCQNSFKICDGSCHWEEEISGEFIEHSYNDNLLCRYAYESQNSCVIKAVDDFQFSGISYDLNFNPHWWLTINDERLDSSNTLLKKIYVNNDVIYDIKRDDIWYWYNHNGKLCDQLLEIKTINHCNDWRFIDEFHRVHHIPLPCNAYTVYSFLTKKIASWREA